MNPDTTPQSDRADAIAGSVVALVLLTLATLAGFNIGREVGRTDAAVLARDLDNPCGRACVRFCEEVRP